MSTELNTTLSNLDVARRVQALRQARNRWLWQMFRKAMTASLTAISRLWPGLRTGLQSRIAGGKRPEKIVRPLDA